MSRSDNAPLDAQYRLLLLGPASLTDATGALLPGMGPGKPLAMLAYLVINGSAQRDELVGLLWPEMPEDRARNAFRQTLHRLRNALGQQVLATDREAVSVTAAGQLWCDALEFQQVASGNLDRAIALYRGPFLGGMNVGSAEFEHWTETQRDRLEAQYRGLLTRAASASLEAGETDRAVEYAHSLSRVAPLDHNSALLEARTLVAAGRKPEAISVLTQHASLVEAELGSKPPAAVVSMLQRLVNEAPAAETVAAAADADLLTEAEFLGRDRDLGKLLALWRGIERRGAFAVVTGPPGIGKTRLLKELTQRIAAFGPALLLWGQERHGNRTIPYAALADALRPAVNAPGVAGASQHLLAEAARLLPEIRDQFNLPEARPLEDDAARIRFFEGVASLLDAVAFEQPVCVVLEDLQHASRSTAELLQFLTQKLAAAPVLFLASYRPADSPRYVLELFGKPEIARNVSEIAPDEPGPDRTILPLAALAPDVIAKLVASVTSPNEIDADSSAAIAGASDGNPFRALELVRRLRRGEPLAKPPAEISGILWARLQSCSSHEQRIFLASALLGRPVPLRVLAAATHLPEPVAFDAALVLEQRGLTLQRNGGVTPAHDVVALLALEGTGSAGRALLAGWTADALAAEPGTSNAELAQLYAAAGQPSSAHAYARAAVLDAAASGAGDELDNLLALAAQTALNNRDRLAVDGLRRAFRGGAMRLQSGIIAPPDNPPAVDEEPPPAASLIPEAVAVGPGERPRSPKAAPAGWRKVVATHPLQVGLGALLLIAASTAFVLGRVDAPGARGTVLADSVIVAERIGARGTRQYVVTGSIQPSASLSATSASTGPPWLARLSLPWINPQVSPDGRRVAVEHITPRGTDVFVMDVTGRDTIPLTTQEGDDLIAGWSPDGQWLLVIHGSAEDASYRSALHAYSVVEPGRRFPLDTTAGRAVVDAVWSPTGMHVAWTARTGETRQQDVFVGMGGGSPSRNVTASDGEDYRPSWSPDGERLVFTSDRSGDAELYSIELRTGETRRLTVNPAQDDHAAFSRDGDFIAFESTRDGHVGVYVMPLDGIARRLTPTGRNFELLGWRGRAPGYVAELRAAAPATLAVGARAELSAAALDQYGSQLATPVLEWAVLDDAVELVEAPAGSGGDGARRAIVARSSGIARVVVRAGTWRADTAFTLVGAPLTLLSDDFSDGLSPARWSALGDPLPAIVRGTGLGGGNALVLHSDRQWESGVLGTAVFPLRPGLSLSVRVRAPFSAAGRPGGFSVALVAAEAGEAIDPAAPQFLKVAALTWLADAGRLAYSAEREFWSEAVRFARGNDWHDFRIEVEADGRVAFYVEGMLRRRSSIVLTGKEEDLRVQLWLGGRGTGADVSVDDVLLRVGEPR